VDSKLPHTDSSLRVGIFSSVQGLDCELGGRRNINLIVGCARNFYVLCIVHIGPGALPASSAANTRRLLEGVKRHGRAANQAI
jgi:hypothetical protein